MRLLEQGVGGRNGDRFADPAIERFEIDDSQNALALRIRDSGPTRLEEVQHRASSPTAPPSARPLSNDSRSVRRNVPGNM